MLTTAAHSSPVRRATSGTFSAFTSIHSPRKAPACAACCSGVSGGITSAAVANATCDWYVAFSVSIAGGTCPQIYYDDSLGIYSD